MINCYCGGELDLDIEETKKNGVLPVYNCNKCNNLFILKKIGEKEIGFRTKKLLQKKKFIDNIPF